MPNILVTGSSGLLGDAVVKALQTKGARVTGLSRHASPEEQPGVTQFRGDLLQPDSLWGAFRDIDVVVHCASKPMAKGEDVTIMSNLLQAAKGVQHIVYVGIAGIEDAAKVLPYYQSKLSCESLLEISDYPFTTVRSTQFHTFVSSILSQLRMGPFQLVPKMTLQPVDVQFVAERLAAYALSTPQGRAPDVHGPQSLTETALVDAWMRSRNIRRRRLALPPFGPMGAFSKLIPASGESGGTTWNEWLLKTRRP